MSPILLTKLDHTRIKKALEPAERGEDEATIDLLTQRLNTHSKTAWMLRSHLE